MKQFLADSGRFSGVPGAPGGSLGSSGGGPGALGGQCWGHLGSTMNFYENFDPTWRPSWSYVGTKLRPSWSQVGVKRGPGTLRERFFEASKKMLNIEAS